jgi:hypothetical protein
MDRFNCSPTSVFLIRLLNQRPQALTAPISDTGYLSSPESAAKVRLSEFWLAVRSVLPMHLRTAIHDPHGKLSPKEFAKLNYPAPIVDHSEARARALARYKNPGEGDAE